MRNFLWTLLVVIVLNGCAGPSGPGDLLHRFSEQRRLSGATSLLEQGKTDAALAVLDSLSAPPGVPGVSDEALLRLGLLHLGGKPKLGSSAQTRLDLENLIRRYPASSWAQMSSNLSATLEALETAFQQAKRSGELNDSLWAEYHDLKSSYNSLVRKNKEFKAMEGSLVEENSNYKVQVDELTKENMELRRVIEQLKTLDLELERKHKR